MIAANYKCPCYTLDGIPPPEAHPDEVRGEVPLLKTDVCHPNFGIKKETRQ